MKELVARLKKSSDEVGDCWEWRMALHNISRSPVIWFDGATRRVAWVTAVAQGLDVSGKIATCNCANFLCVNPAHVEVITVREFRKRVAAATKYYTRPARLKKLSQAARARSKLTIEIAHDIRSAEGSQSEIAARFGVSKQTINQILQGKTWRDWSNPFLSLIIGKP